MRKNENEIEIATLRSRDVEPAHTERKPSFWDDVSKGLASIENELQFCMAQMSGNPIERNPLVLEDAQGRQRVVTMQNNANQVKTDVRKVVTMLFAVTGASMGVMGGMKAQDMTEADLGDALAYVKKDLKAELDHTSKDMAEVKEIASKKLEITVLDQVINLQTNLDTIQKRLDERKAERQGARIAANPSLKK
ncbi:MAG: hypothetical protein WCW31_01545 [Patescibacteria group bacterium]|jgi:hypothetical protein